MSSVSKRASFDNSSTRNPHLRPRGSTQLVAPWEQENDAENFVSSQFINFLDSKMRNADGRKKSPTPQASFNAPMSINNLSRSHTMDESLAKGDSRTMNRKRITERAMVKGNPVSMSTTVHVFRRISEKEESGPEDLSLTQKRLTIKKEISAGTTNSHRWGIMPQFQTRMRRGDQGRVAMVLNKTDPKQRSLYAKRPSTSTAGFFMMESEEKPSAELSRNSKGSFAKLEKFFAHTEGDHIAERYNNKGTWDVDYYQGGTDKSRIRSRKMMLSNGTKNFEEYGATNGESNTREFVEVIRRHKPQVKSRERYEMSTEEIELGCIGKSLERKEDTVIGDFGMTKNLKHPLSYLFPVSVPAKTIQRDTNSDVQAQAIKMIIETMPNKNNARKYEEESEYNFMINVNQKNEKNEKTFEKDVTPKQVSSVLVPAPESSSEEVVKPAKKMRSTLGFKGFKPVIHSPKISGFSVTSQLNMTSDTLRPSTTKSKTGAQRYINESEIEQCIETVLDPEITEKPDIQSSINITNRIWTSHKDRYGPGHSPLFRNLKKTLEDRNQRTKTETSAERTRGVQTSARGGFHPKTTIRSGRPETATNRDLVQGVLSPKGDDNRFQGLTKRPFVNKTVRAKESPIFQKSLDKIRSKANCDVSKSIRIQNYSNVNVWEDEDLGNRGATSFDKLKAILNTSSVQAMYAPRDISGSNTSSYQVKNISFQTAGAELGKVPKRPKLKKK